MWSPDTWLDWRCLAPSPPGGPLAPRLNAHPWTWRRWLDILFLCCAALFPGWTDEKQTACEVFNRLTSNTPGHPQKQSASPAVVPWYDLRGRFFTEVFNFLRFGAIPDLGFPLGLEGAEGRWPFYKTPTTGDLWWVQFQGKSLWALWVRYLGDGLTGGEPPPFCNRPL